MGRGEAALTERATTVAVTAGTPLMARAPPEGGRGRGVAVTGMMCGGCEEEGGGREEVVKVVLRGCRGSAAETIFEKVLGSKASWLKMVSGRMAGGRAGASWPVLTVQARATAGGPILARGSMPVEVFISPSSSEGRRTGGGTILATPASELRSMEDVGRDRREDEPWTLVRLSRSESTCIRTEEWE